MNKIAKIVDQTEICPYCGDAARNRIQCCGENHFETAYEIEIGGVVESQWYTLSDLDNAGIVISK